MPTNFPNGVRSYGVPLPSGTIPATKGNVYHVDSGHTNANNGNNGLNPNHPMATIDAAIGRCTANNGDIILVSEGHAETVAGAAGIDFDIAGIRCIGLGQGAYRPTITMSAAASTIHFDAIGTHLENFLIDVQHDCTIVINVDRADCVIKDCEFRARTAVTAREWVTCIDVAGAAANACDRLKVIGCFFNCPTAGASNCIGLDEIADSVEIAHCWFWGDFADAAIHNPIGFVCTNLLVRDCFIANLQTGDHAIELVSASTGALVRNMYHTDLTQQTACDTGACFSFECYHCDAVDVGGILSPIIT
jgi:hypothetical protein